MEYYGTSEVFIWWFYGGNELLWENTIVLSESIWDSLYLPSAGVYILTGRLAMYIPTTFALVDSALILVPEVMGLFFCFIWFRKRVHLWSKSPESETLWRLTGYARRTGKPTVHMMQWASGLSLITRSCSWYKELNAKKVSYSMIKLRISNKNSLQNHFKFEDF